MASSQDIEKIKRNVDETWEEAFKGVEKTSEKFDKLVEEFVSFVEDWKGFSDIRRDRLADYLTDLDDVSKHWKEINTWVEQNSDSLGTYVGSLTDIRDLFQNISAEVGGLRRQTLDRINLTRNLARLAESSVIAVRQEGGLTDKVVTNLRRKGETLTQQYYTQLKILGIKDPTNEKEVVDRQAQENSKLQTVNSRIRLLERVQKQVGHLSATERAELRTLKEQAQYHTINVELLDKYNKKAVEGLQEQLKDQQKLFREQRRANAEAGPNKFGAARVGVASKLLGKFGLTDAAADLNRDYGEWVTRRVEAKQGTKVAQKRVEESNQVVNGLVGDQGKLLARKKGVQQQKEQKEKELGKYEFNKEADRWISKDTGRFIDTETITKLQKAVTNLTGIENDLQKKYTDNAAQIAAAQVEQKAATTGLLEAEKKETIVFSQKFSLLKGIGSSLKDSIASGAAFAAIWGILLAHAIRVDELASNLRQRTGTWEISMAAVNSQFASAADWLQTAVELADSFNIAPQTIFTPTEIGKMAEAKNLLGMSAEQVQNMGVYAKITNQTSDSYRKSVNQGFQEYNRLNRTAINYGNVQKETLNTSNALRLSIGGNGEALGRAANAALELGMHMQDVENIASNLINFESSIEAEMQAQLLTGKQLNLAKAREYALNNDIEGVVTEIKKQGIDSAWWGNSNRIQQENMAKALGMSREQMAKMIVQQELQNHASAEMLAKNMKVTEEEVKAMGMADTWKKSIEQLAQAFVPIIEVVRPIVELLGVVVSKASSLIGWIFSLGGLLDRVNEKTSKWVQTFGKLILAWPLFGRYVGTFFGGFSRGISSSIAGVGKLTASMGLLFTKIKTEGLANTIKAGTVGKVQKAWKSGIDAAKSGKNIAKATAGTGAATAAGKTAQTVKGTGSNLPKLGSSIASFLKRFDKVTWGSIAKVPVVGLALLSFVPSAPAIALLSAIGPLASKGLPLAGKGIARFFSTIGKINLAGVVKGVVAMTLMAVPLTVMGLALKTFNEIEWGAVLKGLVSLGALTLAFVVLGAVMSSGVGAVAILLGAVAMGIMAGAVWVLGKALQEIQKVDWETIGMLPVAVGALALAGLLAIPAGIGLAIGAPLLLFGAIPFAAALRVLSSIPAPENLGSIIDSVNALQNLKAPSIGEAIKFWLASIFLKKGLRRLASVEGFSIPDLTPLLTLAGSSNAILATASAIKTLSGAVEEMSEKLASISLVKLGLLSKVVKSVGLQKAATEAIAIPQTSGEIQGIQRENITAAAQEVTVKQTEAQMNSQQISVEQKAADLKVIEEKIDKVVAAIGNSRPDWNWVEFGQEMKRSLAWVNK